MTMIKHVWVSVWVWLALVAPLRAFQSTSQQPDGFISASELPPTEQIPAAPLLIAAYAIVWIALAVYLWSIWSRMGRVERELQMLQQQRGRGAR
jgi:CcmD family protein